MMSLNLMTEDVTLNDDCAWLTCDEFWLSMIVVVMFVSVDCVWSTDDEVSATVEGEFMVIM